MLYLFGIYGYLGVRKKKWHLGKWKKSSPTIQKVEFSLNLEVWQVILMSITGRWALLRKWECKFFEKNLSHENLLKEVELENATLKDALYLPWKFTCTGKQSHYMDSYHQETQSST